MKILNLGLGILLMAVVAIAADDLDSAFEGLQAAEKSGDSVQIKKFAVETANFAKPIIASPAPETPEIGRTGLPEAASRSAAIAANSGCA